MKILKLGKYWGIRFLGKSDWQFWYQKWKPIWHENRGNYITLGLYFIAIYRGY